MTDGRDRPDLVYVPGGWHIRISTVPLEQGLQAVIRYAQRCHARNVELERAVLECKINHDQGAPIP